MDHSGIIDAFSPASRHDRSCFEGTGFVFAPWVRLFRYSSESHARPFYVYDNDKHDGITSTKFRLKQQERTGHLRDCCLCATRVTSSDDKVSQAIISHHFIPSDLQFGRSMDEPLCHVDPRLQVFRPCPISPLPLSG